VQRFRGGELLPPVYFPVYLKVLVSFVWIFYLDEHASFWFVGDAFFNAAGSSSPSAEFSSAGVLLCL